MSRRPAITSRKMFVATMVSPTMTPRYSWIFRPCTSWVVVMIILSSIPRRGRRLAYHCTAAVLGPSSALDFGDQVKRIRPDRNIDVFGGVEPKPEVDVSRKLDLEGRPRLTSHLEAQPGSSR